MNTDLINFVWKWSVVDINIGSGVPKHHYSLWLVKNLFQSQKVLLTPSIQLIWRTTSKCLNSALTLFCISICFLLCAWASTKLVHLWWSAVAFFTFPKISCLLCQIPISLDCFAWPVLVSLFPVFWVPTHSLLVDSYRVNPGLAQIELWPTGPCANVIFCRWNWQ